MRITYATGEGRRVLCCRLLRSARADCAWLLRASASASATCSEVSKMCLELGMHRVDRTDARQDCVFAPCESSGMAASTWLAAFCPKRR